MHKNTTKKIRKSIKNFKDLGKDLKSIATYARHLSNETMTFSKKRKPKL